VVGERLADLETPVSAFAKLRTLGATFLFESVGGGEQIGRYSFIGVRRRIGIACWKGVATIREGGDARMVAYTDPLVLLRAETARYRRTPYTGLPPFAGGAVGYVGYEAARHFEHLPVAVRDPIGVPEAAFGIHDGVVVFDHLRQKLLVVAHEDVAARLGGEEFIARVFAALDAPLRVQRAATRVARDVSTNSTAVEFEARVARANDLIRKGRCDQAILARRFDVRPAPEPLAMYRALRSVIPAPYMFLLETDGATLVGASPEPLVRVENGRITLRPITSVLPRGRDNEEDLRNETALRASEKDRVHHLQFVDVARETLGRLSNPGTVTTRELMGVDRLSHRMHLMSLVDGHLRPGLDAFDVFRSCFPATGVSGVPRRGAMELIAELEEDQRGPYGGAVGYFDFDGNMDSCMAIRTAIIADGVCRVSAGAVLPVDSDAPEAYTRARVGGMLRAVELSDALGTLGCPR
jgi:anthranilate synthase component 1